MMSKTEDAASPLLLGDGDDNYYNNEGERSAAVYVSVRDGDFSPSDSEVDTLSHDGVFLVEDRGTSSFWSTSFNTMNVLCGVGVLTSPYALAQGGFMALVALLVLGGCGCYTAALLTACMRSYSSVRTYPDLGALAFGMAGRVVVSLLLYLECFCCAVDFIILQGDNLSALVHRISLPIFNVCLSGSRGMMVVVALATLPAIWLRDLSWLSYLSFSGAAASVMLLVLVGWVGHPSGHSGQKHIYMPPLVNWSNMPLVVGVFSFCFAGHAVIPSLYTSTRPKPLFVKILWVGFMYAVLLYGSMAVLGVSIYGGDVSDNITLDMMHHASHHVATHIALWSVIISPISKVALALAPIMEGVEGRWALGTPGKWLHMASCLAIRTGVFGLVLITAIAVPFFSAVMSFIGGFLSMSVSFILPCLFFIRLGGPKRIKGIWKGAPYLMAFVGIISGVLATYDSITRMSRKYGAMAGNHE